MRVEKLSIVYYYYSVRNDSTKIKKMISEVDIYGKQIYWAS